MDKLFDDAEINSISKRIFKERFKRVVIQCPDSMLHVAPEFASKLERRTMDFLLSETDSCQHYEKSVFVVLADSASGAPCCVDAVGAERYLADCIIHLGNSCQTDPSQKISVLYCFPVYNFLSHCFSQQLAVCKSSFLLLKENVSFSFIVLIYDVEYHHCVLDIMNAVKSCFHETLYVALARKCLFHQHCVNENQAPEFPEELLSCRRVSHRLLGRDLYKVGSVTPYHSLEQLLKNGLLIPADPELPPYWLWETDSDTDRPLFIFVGDTNFDESQGVLKPFLLRFGHSQHIFLCNPKHLNTSAKAIEYLHPSQKNLTFMRLCRLLRSRFVCIERVIASQTIGIIYSMIGGERHREVFARAKRICQLNKKTTVSFLMGQLNPTKLDNFPEIDVFCLIACPQSMFQLNTHEYSRPIVTLFELEVALNVREWSTEYITDFNELLDTSPELRNLSNLDQERVEEFDDSSAHVINQSITSVPNETLKKLQHQIPLLVPICQRTFQGVTLEAPEDANTPVVLEGFSGVASSYTKEKTFNMTT